MSATEETFEYAVRTKNPKISEEDIREAKKLLKRIIPTITNEVVLKYTDNPTKQLEKRINQVLRDLRLAGYYDHCPRVRVSNVPAQTQGGLNFLHLKYY